MSGWFASTQGAGWKGDTNPRAKHTRVPSGSNLHGAKNNVSPWCIHVYIHTETHLKQLSYNICVIQDNKGLLHETTNVSTIVPNLHQI